MSKRQRIATGTTREEDFYKRMEHALQHNTTLQEMGLPVVKVAVWAAFWAEAIIVDFGQYWHYVPLLPQIIT